MLILIYLSGIVSSSHNYDYMHIKCIFIDYYAVFLYNIHNFRVVRVIMFGRNGLKERIKMQNRPTV